MASALLLLPDRNQHGNDYTGAFRSQADKFVDFLTQNYPDLEVYEKEIDISEGFTNRRKQVLEALYAQSDLAVLAFFCHGEEEWLQLGFTDSSIGLIAEALEGRVASYIHIALYACSTAKDEEPGPGIAEGLAQAMSKAGYTGHVDGHAESGHTTINASVVRFSFTPEGVEQEWLVDPDDKLLFRKWRDLLKKTDLRFRFAMENTRDGVLEYLTDPDKTEQLVKMEY